MVEISFALAVGSAMLACLGVVLIGYALTPAPVRLDDLFASLDADPSTPVISPDNQNLLNPNSRLEAIGAWIYQRGAVPISKSTLRTLALQGRTIGDYLANKLVLALGGLILPYLVTLVIPELGSMVIVISLVATVIGWFVPDLKQHQARKEINADAAEALNSFFDLVVLERLANLSATQALQEAAKVSSAPVFMAILRALQRAQYEQRAPWPDLEALAEELNLPQIADIADVMRLDEQGAALADALSARVKELRDAHLLQEKIAAGQRSEQLTIWMTLPVVIFALAFLTPPLLALMAN